jgi:hypothetical protein
MKSALREQRPKNTTLVAGHLRKIDPVFPKCNTRNTAAPLKVERGPIPAAREPSPVFCFNQASSQRLSHADEKLFSSHKFWSAA